MTDFARHSRPTGRHAIGEASESAASARQVVYAYLACLAISCCFLGLLAPSTMPVEQELLGIALGALCCLPTALYVVTNANGIPGFEILCLLYGMQYCLVLFLRDSRLVFASGETMVPDDATTSALLMSTLGLVGMQIGYYGMRRASALRNLVIQLPLDRRKAFTYALFMGGVGTAFSAAVTTGILSKQVVGPALAIITLIVSQVNVAIAILVWLSYDAEYAKRAKICLTMIIVAAMALGLLRGEQETLLLPVATLLVARWYHSGKLPLRLMAIGLALFFFLQPTKDEYRQRLRLMDSTSVANTGVVEFAMMWPELAVQQWLNTLSGTGPLTQDTIGDSLLRFDFIHLFGYVRSMTPDLVPYQHGGTYSYLFVSWIPRFLWPDKPLAQEANKFFAVAYGIQTQEGTETSMVGMPVVIEAFVNFGAAGVAILMTLNGMVLGVLDRLMNRRVSGMGGQCVYLGVMTMFLNGMNSNTAALYGGLVQIIICNSIMISFATEKTRSNVLGRAMSG